MGVGDGDEPRETRVERSFTGEIPESAMERVWGVGKRDRMAALQDQVIKDLRCRFHGECMSHTGHSYDGGSGLGADRWRRGGGDGRSGQVERRGREGRSGQVEKRGQGGDQRSWGMREEGPGMGDVEEWRRGQRGGGDLGYSGRGGWGELEYAGGESASNWIGNARCQKGKAKERKQEQRISREQKRGKTGKEHSETKE